MLAWPGLFCLYQNAVISLSCSEALFHFRLFTAWPHCLQWKAVVQISEDKSCATNSSYMQNGNNFWPYSIWQLDSMIGHLWQWSGPSQCKMLTSSLSGLPCTLVGCRLLWHARHQAGRQWQVISAQWAIFIRLMQRQQ